MDLEVHVRSEDDKLLFEALRVVARVVCLDKMVLELLVILETAWSEALPSARLRCSSQLKYSQGLDAGALTDEAILMPLLHVLSEVLVSEEARATELAPV